MSGEWKRSVSHHATPRLYFDYMRQTGPKGITLHTQCKCNRLSSGGSEMALNEFPIMSKKGLPNPTRISRSG